MSDSELIKVCRKGSETVVSFTAENLNRFDSAQRIARDFGELFENGLCRSHPIDCIHVDLNSINRITSVGLNGLIQMNSKSRSHGVRLVLANVPESVRDVFRLTRMERMFEFGSSTEAVATHR
jgi:anti-anti-sigma factor